MQELENYGLWADLDSQLFVKIKCYKQPSMPTHLHMASGCLLVGINIFLQEKLKYLLPGLHTKRCQSLAKYNLLMRLYSCVSLASTRTAEMVSVMASFNSKVDTT